MDMLECVLLVCVCMYVATHLYSFVIALHTIVVEQTHVVGNGGW